MSRLFILISLLLLILSPLDTASASSLLDKDKSENRQIIITSETLVADNKNHTAIFEGSVVARTEDITIYSDTMTVTYDSDAGQLIKIEAAGNVKVHKEEQSMFADRATYLHEKDKIIFTGNAKAVEKGNIISGTKIIFFIKEDRAVVEGSRVVLQNIKGMKK